MADAVTAAFDTAIGAYSQGASGDFAQAQTHIQQNTPANSTAQQTALKNAQGALAAAFSQLGQAAKMESEQQGREGFKSVVALMATTATTAEAVCHQIRLQVGATNPNTTLLASFAAVLTSLAQLSPASVWQEPPGGQG